MKLAIMTAAMLFSHIALGADLAELCSTVEGTYVGKIGEFQSRINLICIDKDRLMASVWEDLGSVGGQPAADKVANLNNVAIDGDHLILANFQLGNEDRRNGSSKSLNTYIRIEIAALSAGKLHGVFMTGNLTELKNVDAVRTQTYPHFAVIETQPFTEEMVAGSYGLANSFFGAANLVFDVLLETPVLYFRPNNTGESIRFTDGPRWDNSGTFSLATPEGNGGEPDDRKLYYIRGHFLENGEMEFYMVSPVRGIEGPLRALRHAPLMSKLHSMLTAVASAQSVEE